MPLVIAAGLAVGAPAPAFAADLFVDGAWTGCPGSGSTTDPFCTISDAIQAALPGDRVVVAPGTYLENLDFLGKAIVVESAAGPTVTVIDGGAIASCVTFATHEGDGAVLRGFTLQNGGGVLLGVAPGGYEIRTGMSVYCEDASPTIEGNVLHGSPMSAQVLGGGIAAYGGAPRIVGNEIRAGRAHLGGGVYALGGSPYLADNDVANHDAAFGAGMYLEACVAPRLVGNRVHDNGTVFYGYASGPGPGVYLKSCQDVEIRDHRSEGNRGTSGGGLGIDGCAGVLVEDAEFVDDATEFEGGGVACWMSADVVIRRARFFDCGGSEGGAIFAYQGDATIEDSRVEGCRAGDLRQVVDLIGAHVLRRSEVVNNGAPPFVWGRGVGLDGGAALEDSVVASNTLGVWLWSGAVRRSTVTGSRYDGVEVNGLAAIEGCVVAGNGLVAGDEIWVAAGSAAVSWSLVAGGFAGVGNLDADPQFVDATQGDFRLRPTSPCIDAGSPFDDACGVDVSGRPRRVSGHLTLASRVDMGAHEFSHVDLTVTRTGPLAYTLDSAGTAGLPALLFVGVAPGAMCLDPAGVLLVDLSSPFAVVAWPATPASVPVTVPASALGDPFVVQQLVLGASPGTGNLSAAVELRVE